MKSVATLLGLFVAGSAAQNGAYFVLGGGGMPLTIGRLDPIMNPQQVPSNHVHSIVGGNAFASAMDYEQAQKATCSTVSPKADKSNYWMPNLYFKDPNNGSFIRVPEQPYHKIYYKYGNDANQYDTDIQEFPKDFRMITGNMFARQEDKDGMGPYGNTLGWMCHGNGTSAYPDVSAVGFPTGFIGCPNGFAAAITFPSCWNGEEFNVTDPSAHMAFPTGDTLQGCPETHRVRRVPQIFVEYWLNIDTFDGLYKADDNPFVLAMGDPTGFGFHADFLNGWDVGVLDSIMPTCNPGNTGSPLLSDDVCFGKHGGTYTDDEMNSCTRKPEIDENVGWTYGEVDNPIGGGLTYGGVVGKKLPGCNPIQDGPDPATIQTC